MLVSPSKLYFSQAAPLWNGEIKYFSKITRIGKGLYNIITSVAYLDLNGFKDTLKYTENILTIKPDLERIPKKLK